MRLILFFDLPMVSYYEIKQYTKFRKFLIKDGFIMMQESVYTKLVLNSTIMNLQIERIKKNKPTSGLVEVLAVTEKQFSRIEYIQGEKQSDIIDSDKRLIIL